MAGGSETQVNAKCVPVLGFGGFYGLEGSPPTTPSPHLPIDLNKILTLENRNEASLTMRAFNSRRIQYIFLIKVVKFGANDALDS